MNKAILMGRLTKDPVLRNTQNNVQVCSFTIAVDRRFKNAQGEREADFIPIVAWRQQAEFVNRYFKQGSRVVVIGSMQNRSWADQEGKKHSITEVIADEVYFADSKREHSDSTSYQGESNYTAPARDQDSFQSGDGFLPSVESDTQLPFDL